MLKMLHRTRQEKGDLEADSHVGCIFQLSFCSPGTAYSFKGLKPVEEGLIKILGEIGVVYIPQGKKHFYPTSLVTSRAFPQFCRTGPARHRAAPPIDAKPCYGRRN